MSIPQTGTAPIENHAMLVEYLEQGSKTPDLWRIGTEHEKFAFYHETQKPIGYDAISSIFQQLITQENWSPLYEGENIIGLEKDGANVSLEPGGQIELSGAPLRTIHETHLETQAHIQSLKRIIAPMGIGFFGLGAAPIWVHADMPTMPKQRYALMTDYMDRVGTMGKSMMYRTTTVQANLDFENETDMVKKMRVSLALQPIATALFATSPFFEGQNANLQSMRSYIWRHLDESRTGMLPFVFEDGMGFERYVDYALDVPMYFVYRDGRYIDARGQSFRDFIAGKLPAFMGEKPLLSDWADHLTTIFPEVRLKKFLEMRGADNGPLSHIDALPAFWTGLLYHKPSLDQAFDLVRDWDHDFRENLRVDAAHFGIRANLGGEALVVFAEKILRLAHEGLVARGHKNAQAQDESIYLDPLFEIVDKGASCADRLIALYNTKWNQDLSQIYTDMAY